MVSQHFTYRHLCNTVFSIPPIEHVAHSRLYFRVEGADFVDDPRVVNRRDIGVVLIPDIRELLVHYRPRGNGQGTHQTPRMHLD